MPSHHFKHARTARGSRVHGIVAVVAACLTISLSPTQAAASPSSASSRVVTSAAVVDAAPAHQTQARRAGLTTVALPLTEAAWTSTRAPRRVMHSSPRLLVRKRSAETFLKFATSALGEREMESIKLQLWAVRGKARLNGLVVQQTFTQWKAENVSHDNRPRLLKAHLNGRARKSPSGRWVNVRLVRTPADLPGDKIAFRLKIGRKALGAKVFARKGKKAPRLAVVTSIEQTPPGPTPAPSPEPTPEPTPTPTPPPSGGAADGTVFAHYFPPYPISIDNAAPKNDYYARNYLTIDGENRKHASYGGLLRDRPVGRAPLGGEWRLEDMRTEVRNAKSGGIDGFTIDILNLSGRNWDATRVLMQAADLEGDFDLIPMLDMTSLRSETAAQIADAMAVLLAHPSARKIGRDYVLSSFCAECRSVSWWAELIDELERRRGLPIKFIATFIGFSDNLIESYAPVSYGAGTWGTRNPAMVGSARNWAAKAHSLGLTWMQPVAVQDARPRSSVYAEAQNTEVLRMTWDRAIRDGADFVQIATWNDYSESTTIAPSTAHGNVFLELTKYYADWFRSGTAPAITSDHLYVTHRVHHWDAEPTSGIKNMRPVLGNSAVKPRDTVEALVFLTAPAWVTVTSGSQTITVTRPAGISTVLVPLGVGTVSSSASRGGAVVTSVTPPHTVTHSPVVQDLQYFAAGS